MAWIQADPTPTRKSVRRSPARAAFWTDVLPDRDLEAARLALSAAALLTDAVAIVAGALATGVLYQSWIESPRPVADFATLGLLIALLFVGLNSARNGYRAAQVFAGAGRPLNLFTLWAATFAVALAIGFFTKSTAFASRGATVLFLAAGFLLLVATRVALRVLVQRVDGLSVALKRRVLLFGCEGEIEAFYRRHAVDGSELKVVAQLALRPFDPADRESRRQLSEDLALATHLARFMDAEDILILLPWAEDALIEECVESFVRVPASIHLGLDGVLRRFDAATIMRLGDVANITLVPKPMTAAELMVKRLFDLFVAGAMLVALAPLLALVALAIKLDSGGPVLFRQTRYGFNQQPFGLHKFRTMTVTENGRAVRQAVANDPRVTRIGRVLRRWNIDELPQLIDVLRGDMSLVGPRPHAMAHDQDFEREFNRYARRHNMKPGITGWAQVNGFRGQIRTREDIRARIEHDLFYIDNWSLWLDIRILLRTVLSPKAYRNAG